MDKLSQTLRQTFMLLALIAFGVTAFAQSGERTVTGKVLDDLGDPLPGVTVQVVDEGKGAITDLEGAFSVVVKGSKSVLRFSYTSFETQDITVGDLGVINVQMKPSTDVLNEVVVVGAGTQKKVSVTGAITSVKGKLLKIPSSSLTSNFAGQLAGVVAMTTSGAPGATSEFYIRGISTFGGRATPLIMLDDVEISISDLNKIPAETIESFSILKDASATAIYGSRGANGVMLITTKVGAKNERTKVNVTVENTFQVPTAFPEYVDGATYMELYNEAQYARNPSLLPKYTAEDIEYTRLGTDPLRYPNVNWKNELFGDFTTSQRANINIQGGGNKATYYMSIQANHDTGILKSDKLYSWDSNIDNWSYNFQNNISYDLTESTKLDLRMNAQLFTSKGPNVNTATIFQRLFSTNPIKMPVVFLAQEGDEHLNFGSYEITSGTYQVNPYAEMVTSYAQSNQSVINTSLKLNQKFDFITEGLSASLLFNFKNWSTMSYNRSIQPYYYRIKPGTYNFDTKEYELERLGTSGTDYIAQSDISKGGDYTIFLQGTLDYARKFGDHSVNGMLLYQQREFRDNVLPRRNQGLSGRFMYNYALRYFAEFNFGYTGTERLAKGDRFEFFPAMSAGWAISEEPFFEPAKDIFSLLKIRASYGLIGSDETGLNAGAPHYVYIDQVNLTGDGRPGFTTGEDLNFTKYGPVVNMYAIQNARWEKVKKFNVGIDADLFDKLSLTAEYFFDQRYDILLKREAWPQSLGYHEAKPWSNKGRVNNWGVELSANYHDQITKDLYIEVRGNFTYNQNKILDIDDPEYFHPWKNRTGFPLSYSFGYIADGLFESQEQIDNSPVQSLGSTPVPGDIKYRDITGDGMITTDDQVMISPYGGVPRIQYGIGMSLVWKKLDFGVFFNGSAKRTIMTGLMSPFGRNDNNVFQYIADNRWTVDNPNPNAAYPRLGLQDSDVQNNAQASTFWMRDGSFIRFKTIELGYSFKYGRVYVNGDNLAVFSKFKQWDPELNYDSYPLQRMFNIGIQLQF